MALGFRLNPLRLLLLGFAIWGLTGLFAFFFNKEGILWEKGIQEFGGAWGLIFTGVVKAALFEEFTRFLVQSCFERVYHAKGFHILFATVIWAFMHFPIAFHDSHDAYSTFVYCIQIIPIGYV